LRLFVVGTAALLLVTTSARAQSQSEPSLAFTIAAGLTSGGHLWSIDNQPLPVSGSPDTDFVGLGRRIRPGLAASLAISFYRSPHFGLNGEIAYVGLGTEQQCRDPAAGYKPDTENTNRQACHTANGLHDASSAISFLAGVTYRILDQTKVQPYVRVNAGLGLLGNSFVETAGYVQVSQCVSADNVCSYPLLLERKRAAASWVASLAAGFAFYLSEGYRVRMEGRDLIMTLPVVQGPAPNTPGGNIAVTRRTIRHTPVFMIGLDVLLERRHTRRY
jgi:hypothetical protein